MHTYTLAGLSLVVLAGAAGVPARSADGASATSTTTAGARTSEPAPKLYTNADLAKFGPPAATTAPRRETPPTDDAANWAFVQSVLDREAARQDTERRRSLEYSSAYEAEGFPMDRGYVPGYYGYGYGYSLGFDPFRFDDPRLGTRFRSNRGFTEGLIPRGHHGRYTFLKGADVVPGPRSPGSGHGSGGRRGGGGKVSHHAGGGGRR